MGRLANIESGPWIGWLLRALVAGGVVLVLSYLPYRLVAHHDQGKLESMHNELSRVQREIRAHETDLIARRLKVAALKNDTGTIEDIARQELQMLYPHEKALRLKRK